MSYIGLYDDAGSRNAFYIIKDKKRIGFKEFGTRGEAEFSYRVQSILADKDLAPRVYGQVGKIRRNSDDELTSYGYLTEVARPMPECYDDENCDGDCFESCCSNGTTISEVVYDLHKRGLEYSDHHRGNFGFVRRNNKWIPVVIDVGIESFSDIDEGTYGQFEYYKEDEDDSKCNCTDCVQMRRAEYV